MDAVAYPWRLALGYSSEFNLNTAILSLFVYAHECVPVYILLCVSASDSWTDGTALDYQNWKNGMPSQRIGQNCISMSLDGKQHQNVLKHSQHTISLTVCILRRGVVNRSLQGSARLRV